MNSIGDNIRKKRTDLGLTQAELADMVGYADKGMISRIESGQVNLSKTRIEDFARALNTTPEVLTGWEEDRKEQSFSYCLEQQMAILGWDTLYDTEGNVILTHEGKSYEVTEDALKEFEQNVAFYMNFMLTMIVSGGSK